MRQGVGLPYGCRNGACGACKGVLREGRLEYGEYQERALHEAEKAAWAAPGVTAVHNLLEVDVLAAA